MTERWLSSARQPNHLMLRSERSERLEAWTTTIMSDPILRDAALRAAPQDEVAIVRREEEKGPSLRSG